MTLQLVNIGAVPNDGTGDDGRTSFAKINASLTILEGAIAALAPGGGGGGGGSTVGLAPLNSPNFTGTPTAPTASPGTATTQIATTSFVTGSLSGLLTAAAASTTYAPKASPALTGTPTAPTAAAGDSSTQLATTAFVQALIASAGTLPAGVTIGSDYYEYTSTAGLVTQIPADDSVPQATEGDSVFSVSRAAAAAANKIEIEFDGWVSGSAVARITAALFIDGASSAVRSSMTLIAVAGAGYQIRLVYRYQPADTASHTFMIRAGADAGGTYRFNGNSGGRLFGGTSAATLRIREIKG